MARKKKNHFLTKVRNDPVLSYALKVRAGKIIAGPHVKNACGRHIDDFEHQEKYGFKWDLIGAKRAIRYYEKILCLGGGEFEGRPFILLPWERFIVGSLFGWKTAIDDYRRFRVAYIEAGKGSGKSPLLAGIGLYMLTADKEPRAEVYAAAVKRDQAMVMFRDAISMVEQSPSLRKHLKMSGSKGKEWNLAYHKTSSFFRPISSEDRGIGQSGPRPHCGLLDEIHEHPTNAMVEFMRAGTKQRRQALILMITNSGHDKRSPCGQYHDYACAIAARQKQDDSFFSFVCSLDEKDDPFKDEKCWIKVNPSLPATPGYKYLREQVREAKGMPSKESLVRRLNFCEWVDAANPWISRDRWMACVKEMDLPADPLPCSAGIDLSGKTDLTALTLAFPLPDGSKKAFSWYWTPKDTLPERENRDRSPYSQWAREGYLTAVDGKSIDYAWVAQQIKWLSEDYQIKILAFDRWRINDLIRELDECGVECYLAKMEIDKAGKEIISPCEGTARGIAMLPHGQGFKDMGPAVDDLEESILNETITIQHNPVTTMCAANAVLQTDPAGGRKFAKQKSTGRIDGMISLVMANRAAKYIDMVKQIDLNALIIKRGGLA